jgi:GT2 family glycosyltransferase
MAPEADRGGAQRADAAVRPAVSVVMPFAGDEAAGRAAAEALALIGRREDDELIVVDNSGERNVPARDGIRIVAADEERSAYYARNAGAEAARSDWLLFVDADCRPRPDILDRFFVPPPADDTGAVVGEVDADPSQRELTARYSRARRHLHQLAHWQSPYAPWGVTANLLVRRAAWDSVGGFLQGIRSGGDTDFSWRLQAAGWKLEYRPEATVEHRHRETVRTLLRVASRYGAGRAWLRRRYSVPLALGQVPRELVRGAVGVVAFGVTGRFERAAFKALDGAYVLSGRLAALLSNTPPGRASHDPSAVAAIAGAFPARDDATAVARVAALGPGVAVEARERPIRMDRVAARDLSVVWAEDDGTLRRTGGALWLVARHPLRVARHLVRGGSARPLLSDVAVPVRRLAAAGVREVAAVDEEAHATAVAIAALLGARVR